MLPVSYNTKFIRASKKPSQSSTEFIPKYKKVMPLEKKVEYQAKLCYEGMSFVCSVPVVQCEWKYYVEHQKEQKI